MSWVRFPHPALLAELLVGLAVDPLQLVLGEIALDALELGAVEERRDAELLLVGDELVVARSRQVA